MDGQPGPADRRPTKRVPNDSDKPLACRRRTRAHRDAHRDGLPRRRLAAGPPPVAGPRGRPRDRGPDRDPHLHHEPKDVSGGASESRPEPLGDQEQPALGPERPDGRGRSAEPDGPRPGEPRGRPENRPGHRPPHGRQALDPAAVPMGGAKSGLPTQAHPTRSGARARDLKCGRTPTAPEGIVHRLSMPTAPWAN